MAIPISNNEEFGYDAIFVDEIPEELKCVVCHLVLQDPLQIMTCGHRFCSPCFNQMKIHSQQTNIELICPVDRGMVVLGQVFPDRGIARSIGNLETRCENLKEGCDWRGDLRDLQKHQIGCACGVTKQSSLCNENQDDPAYLLNDLLLRLQKCEEGLKVKEKRLEICEKDLIKKEKDIACCKVSITEMKDDANLRDQVIEFLKSSNLQLQNEVSSLAKEKAELTKVGVGCEVSNRTEDELRRKMDVLADELAIVNRSLSTHQMQTLDEDIYMKLKSCEKEIRMINANVSSLEEFRDNTLDNSINLENISFSFNSFDANNNHDIEFQWVMTNYKEKFDVGNQVCSPLFYTAFKGYRFRLVVKWTGPRKGKLGLFLRLHRDSSHKRPLAKFNHEYTLGVMDKHGNGKTFKITSDEIRRNPLSFTIQDGQEVVEEGFGFDDMLTAPYQKYVINNALFITCVIHV